MHILVKHYDESKREYYGPFPTEEDAWEHLQETVGEGDFDYENNVALFDDFNFTVVELKPTIGGN